MLKGCLRQRCVANSENYFLECRQTDMGAIWLIYLFYSRCSLNRCYRLEVLAKVHSLDWQPLDSADLRQRTLVAWIPQVSDSCSCSRAIFIFFYGFIVLSFASSKSQIIMCFCVFFSVMEPRRYDTWQHNDNVKNCFVFTCILFWFCLLEDC